MSAEGSNVRSARMRLAGLVYLLVVAAFLTLTVLVYQGRFTSEVRVTLRTDHLGNQLQTESDVKVRGVLVGEVRAVRTRGEGAELVLALDPRKADMIPRNVSARLLPKTLFGERYVSLVLPQRRDPTPLSTGDVIAQDRSASAIELERVLGDLLPLLQAVQPEKLSASLTSLARALEGRGAALGDTLVRVNDYLRGLDPSLPDLKADITALASASDTYDASATDFLQSLSDFTVTSKTVVDQRTALDELFRDVTSSSEDLTKFLERNRNTLIRLGDSSRETLALLAEYAPGYACVLRAIADFKPRMDKALGKGTDEPGLHVDLMVVPGRGSYQPGRDDPAYRDKRGPRCYDLDRPLPAGRIDDGSSPPRGSSPGPAPSAPALSALSGLTGLSAMDGGANLANSAQEREFVAAVLAPVLGVPPREVPAWSSVLVGPLLRGTEVTVR